jgi:hypothetical protein
LSSRCVCALDEAPGVHRVIVRQVFRETRLGRLGLRRHAWLIQVQQAQRQRGDDGGAPVARGQLVAGVLQVEIDRSFADSEQLADLAAGLAQRGPMQASVLPG